MQLPVTLQLHPSRTLAVALVLAHGLAALGVASSDLPVAWSLLGGALLTLSLVLALRRRVFRLPARALTLKADGALELLCGDVAAAAQVRAQTTVLAWLVVLLVETETGKFALALPPDALGREAHRRLRLWLRWRANATAA